jgi:hypothetical protein
MTEWQGNRKRIEVEVKPAHYEGEGEGKGGAGAPAVYATSLLPFLLQTANKEGTSLKEWSRYHMRQNHVRNFMDNIHNLKYKMCGKRGKKVPEIRRHWAAVFFKG